MTVSSRYPAPGAGNGAFSSDSQNVVPCESWVVDLSFVGTWAPARRVREMRGAAARVAMKVRRCIADSRDRRASDETSRSLTKRASIWLRVAIVGHRVATDGPPSDDDGLARATRLSRSGAGLVTVSFLGYVSGAMVAPPTTRAFDLAQVNVALPRETRISALFADFMAALAPIHALAESSSGFVWRFQEDGADAVSVRRFGGDSIVFNMSTWESLDALAEFAFKSAHAEIMRERRKWFLPMKEAYAALWWVPIGHRPSIPEAEERVAHLREHGPTPFAFTFTQPFPMPHAVRAAVRSAAD
jgi:Domain of unknown function (DUF3291)